MNPDDAARLQAGGITALSVAGYKSFYRERAIELRPLTILAGPNNAGKSAVMQPVLLWKQTLEAPYEPEVLRLDGPHVHSSVLEQLFARRGEGSARRTFMIGMRLGRERWLRVRYVRARHEGGPAIRELVASTRQKTYALRPGMQRQEIEKLLREVLGRRVWGRWEQLRQAGFNVDMEVVSERCFLVLRRCAPVGQEFFALELPVAALHAREILRIIHLPASRTGHSRTFPVTAVRPTFPGTFDAYVGMLIAHWQRTGDPRLAALTESGRKMGLFQGITAVWVSGTEIDVRVRGMSGKRWDSLPDVGAGVAEVLPVLVALHAAAPGQLVYVEHPESCLHPGAEVALAEEFADAALRGVRLVAEIHSQLLLLTVQTIVAEGKLPPELVKLHWFERSARGETIIAGAGLDRAGAYGPDWPGDLGMIEWRATRRYLDACEESEGARGA